jgi:hypothetical protein
VQDHKAALLRLIGSVSNLSLLRIGGHYNYHPHDKRVERKMVIRQGYSMGIGGCNRLCPAATGLSLVALFSLSLSIEEHPLHWTLVKS